MIGNSVSTRTQFRLSWFSPCNEPRVAAQEIGSTWASRYRVPTATESNTADARLRSGTSRTARPHRSNSLDSKDRTLPYVCRRPIFDRSDSAAAMATRATLPRVSGLIPLARRRRSLAGTSRLQSHAGAHPREMLRCQSQRGGARARRAEVPHRGGVQYQAGGIKRTVPRQAHAVHVDEIQ